MDAPPDDSPGPDVDQYALRRLAERLLDHGSPFGLSTEKPRLFVGRLPEELPVEVPIPGGLVLLGCVSRGGEMTRHGPRVQAVLDSGLPPDESLAAYRRTLSEEGWYESEDRRRRPRVGFVSAPESEPALFCKSQDGPGLAVSARPAPGFPAGGQAVAEVSLALFTDPSDNPCEPERLGPHTSSKPPIPALVPPPGVRTLSRPGRSGGGPDEWHSDASLAADLAPVDLEAHYAAQLGTAGWSRIEGGSGERHAWSVWEFEHRGQLWMGTFSATEIPGHPGRHRLRLQAYAVPGG